MTSNQRYTESQRVFLVIFRDLVNLTVSALSIYEYFTSLEISQATSKRTFAKSGLIMFFNNKLSK